MTEERKKIYNILGVILIVLGAAGFIVVGFMY